MRSAACCMRRSPAPSPTRARRRWPACGRTSTSSRRGRARSTRRSRRRSTRSSSARSRRIPPSARRRPAASPLGDRRRRGPCAAAGRSQRRDGRGVAVRRGGDGPAQSDRALRLRAHAPPRAGGGAARVPADRVGRSSRSGWAPRCSSREGRSARSCWAIAPPLPRRPPAPATSRQRRPRLPRDRRRTRRSQPACGRRVDPSAEHRRGPADGRGRHQRRRPGQPGVGRVRRSRVPHGGPDQLDQRRDDYAENAVRTRSQWSDADCDCDLVVDYIPGYGEMAPRRTPARRRAGR